MLTHTFLHVPGIGETTEQRLWSLGLADWDCLSGQLPDAVPPRCRSWLPAAIEDSRTALAQLDASYFARRLEPRHHWRLYSTFRRRTAFLDIETTGMDAASGITTIALYDGQAIRTYVRDQNLHEFPADVQAYRMLVTYNGRSFDVPFLQREFPSLRFDQAHCDLRYFLASLGYKGGLKGCERTMGIPRSGPLRDVDGYTAVLLWQRHLRGDGRALPALLRYNIEDAVNLQWLMETAYNMTLSKLPIRVTPIDVAQRPYINWPFDPSIIDELARPPMDYERHWSVRPRMW
jgi:uncharacterized protein